MFFLHFIPVVIRSLLLVFLYYHSISWGPDTQMRYYRLLVENKIIDQLDSLLS
jgi:hypothetical protein